MVTHFYIMKHHFACFISHVFSLTCQFLPLSTQGKVQDKAFPSNFSSRILIWRLFLWRLTGLDLSNSTNSELSCEFCSCSPFPPSIGSTLCLIKHVMVFHGLFLLHPSFLSHLMSFHVNFLQQLWLIFKITFSTFLLFIIVLSSFLGKVSLYHLQNWVFIVLQNHS